MEDANCKRLSTAACGLLMAGLTMAALVGCSTGMVAKEDLKDSKLTISQYVEDRFLTGLLPYQKNQRRTRDGGVLFNAFFNERNPAQLAQPRQNLMAFCEAKGGSLVRVTGSRSLAGVLATPRQTPSDVFLVNREVYRATGFSEQLANLTAAYDADFYDKVVKTHYPQSIRNVLAGADQAGAFGKFSCEENGKPVWLATIQPVSYNPPSDPNNLLVSPWLTVYIKGEDVRPFAAK